MPLMLALRLCEGVVEALTVLQLLTLLETDCVGETLEQPVMLGEKDELLEAAPLLDPLWEPVELREPLPELQWLAENVTESEEQGEGELDRLPERQALELRV